MIETNPTVLASRAHTLSLLTSFASTLALMVIGSSFAQRCIIAAEQPESVWMGILLIFNDSLVFIAAYIPFRYQLSKFKKSHPSAFKPVTAKLDSEGRVMAGSDF